MHRQEPRWQTADTSIDFGARPDTFFAVRSGEHTARDRAASVLGTRLHERFVLADALHVIACEQGTTSWPALVRQHRRGPIRAGLDDARDGEGVAEIDVETLRYPDG